MSRRIIINEKGQGMVEYIIIVALIAVASIGIMSTLGTGIRKHFANITNRFINRPEISQIVVTEAEHRRRDMDDYHRHTGQGSR